MNKRLYPIEEEKFNSVVEPYIKQQYKRTGRHVEIYQKNMECGIQFIRDLKDGV